MAIVVALLMVLAAGVSSVFGQPAAGAVQVGVGQQSILTPGFAIGDVNAANASVADFLVGRGRRQVTIIGRKAGSASIALWDQAGRNRLNLTITVVRELDGPTARELQRSVAPYPLVSLATLQGEPVLKGEVDRPEDLQLLRGLARAAGVECLVIVRPPPLVEAARSKPFTMQYDLRLLEADVNFTTQSYDDGVQPSGRELYRTTLTATVDATAQGFIGGGAAMASRKKVDTRLPAPDTGLRISLTPRRGASDAAETAVIVETNLPIASTVYVATEWRRFQQNFTTHGGAPFAIAGNDLLAAPDRRPKGSVLKDASRWIARITGLPGISGAKGAGDVPIFANLVTSVAYREGRTQLVLVVHPRVVVTPQE